MNEIIVMPGSTASPDAATANYQEESKLKQEVMVLWGRYKKNGEELGRKLAQLQGILRRRKGRAGSFVAWLEEHHIPPSTAYRLIAEARVHSTCGSPEDPEVAEDEGTSKLAELPGNSHLGNSEAGENDNPWADGLNACETSTNVMDVATTTNSVPPEDDVDGDDEII